MLPTGTRLGRYEILAPLGRGGMGEVYRARDVRLDREVAVKVLPQGVAQDPDRLARFEQEARAVAALAHPNILVLHDVGNDLGIPYAVTELLEGVTLRGRLSAAPLAWREAIEIGAAAAEGLAVAHAKGIIHRDIKPENLFLTADGRVKILDFGLAKVQAAATKDFDTQTFVAVQTDPGTVVGTVGYMSPEQLRGLRVDARSDLFSLGCVLYELVTRKRPFQGRTGSEVSAAILHESPPPLAHWGTSVPADVERVIGHCLAKPVAERFASARDLAFALRALLSDSDAPTQARSPAPARKRSQPKRAAISSLAVLPLVNANVDPEVEYLSDGITESVINLLSQLPGLRVMARSTMFRYKGKDPDAQEVGRALKVRAVLGGRLFQRGSRLIIKVELVDVKDGSQLWGEQYNRDMSEVLVVEQAIAQAIVEKLRVRLSGEQQRRVARPVTESTEAYQCYLKGRYHWNKRTEEGLHKSIKLFEQAIEIDPTYALAYCGIADALVNLGGWGHVPFREAYPRAKAAARRALEIDETLAEAHVSLAMAQKEHDWDWAAAGKSYERALELNPNCATAHQWYGEYLAAVGRHAEAIAAMQRAIELDPLSLIIQATLGRHGYYFAHQYDAAIAQLKKTLALDANFWVARLWLGWTYANVGRHAEAIAELEATRQLDGNLEILAALGAAYGLAGRRADAERILHELDDISKTRYVSPMNRALVFIGMKEFAQALDWLERAYEERAQLLSELGAEPAFDPIRTEPRFVDLLRRVGLKNG
jgi:serine/threonine protein kinase/tetratricopeptide (TPR) repeat protein